MDGDTMKTITLSAEDAAFAISIIRAHIWNKHGNEGQKAQLDRIARQIEAAPAVGAGISLKEEDQAVTMIKDHLREAFGPSPIEGEFYYSAQAIADGIVRELRDFAPAFFLAAGRANFGCMVQIPTETKYE